MIENRYDGLLFFFFNPQKGFEAVTYSWHLEPGPGYKKQGLQVRDKVMILLSSVVLSSI